MRTENINEIILSALCEIKQEKTVLFFIKDMIANKHAIFNKIFSRI